MLHKAILAKENLPLFAAKEDSLTATILGTMLYLEDKTFWEILLAATNLTFTECNKTIETVHFWAKWNAENTTNINYVEPDVLIQTTDFDLIIEAKRWDSDQHYLQQWQNEIQSYWNEYGKGDKKLYFLALGTNNILTEQIKIDNKTIEVFKCKWKDILFQVHQKSKNTIDSGKKRILQDIIHWFNLHGFFEVKWENTGDFLSKIKNLTPIQSHHITTLSQNQFQYKTKPIFPINGELSISKDSLLFFQQLPTL